MSAGPYESWRDADRSSLHAGDGRTSGMTISSANLAQLTAAVSGIELGAYDRRIIDWLADYEPATVAVICGLISRARDASSQSADLGLALDAIIAAAGPDPAREAAEFAARRADEIAAAGEWALQDELADRQAALEQLVREAGQLAVELAARLVIARLPAGEEAER